MLDRVCIAWLSPSRGNIEGFDAPVDRRLWSQVTGSWTTAKQVSCWNGRTVEAGYVRQRRMRLWVGRSDHPSQARLLNVRAGSALVVSRVNTCRIVGHAVVFAGSVEAVVLVDGKDDDDDNDDDTDDDDAIACGWPRVFIGPSITKRRTASDTM